MSDPIKAQRFSEIAHAGQLYGSGVPYSVHTQAVSDVLIRFGFTDPVMQSASRLHDCLEDSNTSYNDLRKEFGIDTAELVYAVTDELGRNREERHKKTYGKIRGNYLATALKLADRIANVEYGNANGGKADMYKKEWQSFVMAVYHDEQYGPQQDGKPWPTDGRVARMWTYLAKLFGEEM